MSVHLKLSAGMDCKKNIIQKVTFSWLVCRTENHFCKTKPNIMKKKVIFLSCALLAAVYVLMYSQDNMSQKFQIFPVQNNYTVDSLEIVPAKTYSDDVIKLVAYTTHTSGGCNLENYRIWKCNNIILVDATYEKGMLTYICHSIDTLKLGILPPGNYFLLFDWMDTISFTVNPKQNVCRAYFTYEYPKCLEAKCLNAVSFSDSSGGNVVNWEWDFGDGKTSNNKNPSHTYEKPGVYYVCLTIACDNGCTSSYCEKVPVGQTDSCKAYFDVIYPDCYASNAADCISNHVAFLDKSVGGVTKWHWDFGDGQSSEIQNPVHLYDQPGAFEVCLTIKTKSGCTDTYCDTVYIRLPKCQADFTWKPLRCGDYSSRCLGAYQFVDMSIGELINWNWDFGDGDTSSLQNPVHIFKNDGIYPISLSIATAYGCTDTHLDTLIIGDTTQPRCKADFRWDPLLCLSSILPCPNSFSFTDLSIGKITDWYWQFGDGDTSTFQNPVHRYENDGRYTVSLTINTSNGCTDTKTDTLLAGDTIPPCCKADFKWEEEYPNWDCAKKSTNCITPFHYIQFTDASSGSVLSWKWDFGDGTSSFEPNPFHQYTFSGSYNVCLTVTCNGWCYDRLCKNIVVGDTIPGQCKADFTVSDELLPCLCPACYCVQFLDNSNWNTVEWYWEFGDGDTSVLKNPVHTYSAVPGDTLYNVCLTIRTSDNCTDKICKLFNPQHDSLMSGVEDQLLTTGNLTLYPNPAHDNISLMLNSNIAGDFILSIVDMYGRKIATRSYSSHEISNSTILYNVANLNNGQYICIIVTDGELYKGRFTITR